MQRNKEGERVRRSEGKRVRGADVGCRMSEVRCPNSELQNIFTTESTEDTEKEEKVRM
jgi:hypothetical protein